LAYEPYVAALANVGKMRILGQESIAGVNRVHIGNLGGTDDAIDSQIASLEAALPIQIASSANCTCIELASASE